MKWASAKGSHVWDEHGRKYIDFTSGGIFTANVGNANSHVLGAVRNCLFNNQVSSYTYDTGIRELYVKKLLEVTGFEACALFVSGTDAVEAAIRVMGRSMTGHKNGISAISDTFHGKSYGCQYALWRLKLKNIGRMGIESLHHWMVEGYRGWDALFWPDRLINHLQKCQEKGYLICFDEVQSGFGRTGRFFAYEHYGIKPDLVCFGKGAGGGLPLSGIVGSAELLKSVDLTSTHGGNPISCAAGLAVLEEMERLGLVKKAARKGELMHKWLGEEVPGVKIQGRGMVAAVMCQNIEQADRVVSSAESKGLLVVRTSKSSVKLGPPLTISEEHLREGLEILKEVVNSELH